jgi:hypothetical protein
LFVAGIARDTNDVSRGVVRKSSNQGLTWSTVDDYSLNTTTDSAYNSISTDANGKVYVAGVHSTPQSIGTWVLRRSVDAGLTWNSVTENSKLGLPSNTNIDPQSQDRCA